MGVFTDIRQQNLLTKVADRRWGTGAAVPPSEGVEATAQIVTVGAATAMVNHEPLIPLELLLLRDDLPPRPVSTAAVVPMVRLGQLLEGGRLRVRVSRSDPHSLVIVWD